MRLIAPLLCTVLACRLGVVLTVSVRACGAGIGPGFLAVVAGYRSHPAGVERPPSLVLRIDGSVLCGYGGVALGAGRGLGVSCCFEIGLRGLFSHLVLQGVESRVSLEPGSFGGIAALLRLVGGSHRGGVRGFLLLAVLGELFGLVGGRRTRRWCRLRPLLVRFGLGRLVRLDALVECLLCGGDVVAGVIDRLVERLVGLLAGPRGVLPLGLEIP